VDLADGGPAAAAGGAEPATLVGRRWGWNGGDRKVVPLSHPYSLPVISEIQHKSVQSDYVKRPF